jgi:hypothetical protein
VDIPHAATFIVDSVVFFGIMLCVPDLAQSTLIRFRAGTIRTTAAGHPAIGRSARENRSHLDHGKVS